MSDPRPVDFRPGRSARDAHEALKASIEARDHAEHRAVLWFADIMRRKLYRELGYSSINQYATSALGWSRTRTGDMIRLAGKLDELPALRDSIAGGRVGYTKAREVVKVATPRTELAWVAEAERSSRRELERKVALVRRRARAGRRADPDQGELLPPPPVDAPPVELPVRVGLDLTPEQFARYEALWEKLHRLGGVSSKAVVLLEALAALVEKRTAEGSDDDAPRGAPGPGIQIHVHRCEECGRAAVQTSRGEMPLGASDRARTECDARVLEPGGRNRSTIPPAVRRAVLARDRHRCRSPGCGHTRFLEVHHVRPRSLGGSHGPENLITLCSACHRLAHERGGGF